MGRITQLDTVASVTIGILILLAIVLIREVFRKE